jgi:hypothetical protein
MLANAHCILGDVEAARRDVATAVTVNPYLSAALFVDNVRHIVRNESLAAPFVRGLIESGLVPAPAAQPP